MEGGDVDFDTVHTGNYGGRRVPSGTQDNEGRGSVAPASGQMDQSLAPVVRVGDRGPIVHHGGQQLHGNVQVHPQLTVFTVASSLRNSVYHTQSLHGPQSDAGATSQYPILGAAGEYEHSDQEGAQGRPAGLSQRGGIQDRRH